MDDCKVIAVANQKGGVLLTLVDKRTNLSRETRQESQKITKV